MSSIGIGIRFTGALAFHSSCWRRVRFRCRVLWRCSSRWHIRRVAFDGGLWRSRDTSASRNFNASDRLWADIALSPDRDIPPATLRSDDAMNLWLPFLPVACTIDASPQTGSVLFRACYRAFVNRCAILWQCNRRSCHSRWSAARSGWKGGQLQCGLRCGGIAANRAAICGMRALECASVDSRHRFR